MASAVALVDNGRWAGVCAYMEPRIDGLSARSDPEGRAKITRWAKEAGLNGYSDWVTGKVLHRVILDGDKTAIPYWNKFETGDWTARHAYDKWFAEARDPARYAERKPPWQIPPGSTVMGLYEQVIALWDSPECRALPARQRGAWVSAKMGFPGAADAPLLRRMGNHIRKGNTEVLAYAAEVDAGRMTIQAAMSNYHQDAGPSRVRVLAPQRRGTIKASTVLDIVAKLQGPIETMADNTRSRRFDPDTASPEEVTMIRDALSDMVTNLHRVLRRLPRS